MRNLICKYITFLPVLSTCLWVAGVWTSQLAVLFEKHKDVLNQHLSLLPLIFFKSLQCGKVTCVNWMLKTLYGNWSEVIRARSQKWLRIEEEDLKACSTSLKTERKTMSGRWFLKTYTTVCGNSKGKDLVSSWYSLGSVTTIKRSLIT